MKTTEEIVRGVGVAGKEIDADQYRFGFKKFD